MGKRNAHRKPAVVAATTAILLGWLFLFPTDVPNFLVCWSYDLSQLILPARQFDDPIIVSMDEQAMQIYGQSSPTAWPRWIHARLLDRLTKDQPRVVVFDVVLSQPGDPAEDKLLAEAIHRNGKVVLAGDSGPVTGIPIGLTVTPPLPWFDTNAADWGFAKIHDEADRVGRRQAPGDGQKFGLAWAAAAVAGAPVTQTSERATEERWFNYYGTDRPFARLSLSYSNAESSEPNFFRNKAVFIGGQPKTLLRGETADVFGTPFTKWNNRFAPGVELMAMAYANLVHGDWLRRPGWLTQFGMLLGTGIVAGCGSQWLRLRGAVWLALALAVLVLAVAAVLLLQARLWIPWTIVLLIQIPCGLAFRAFAARAATEQENKPRADVPQPALVPAAAETVQDGLPAIADHTLIRCIGEGAYGQVWIARNAIGLLHAVKIVYLNRFPTTAPYERVLRGIQRFMPVSRSHEGFVHLLQVGRNEAGGFFYYVMEAGDDQKTGSQIDPLKYAPKTLASELQARSVLPPRECLGFMLAVTEAVDRLHQYQLIHRDIKPANIIFVNNRPKLADIDLVTDLSAAGDVTRIGTQGYMAPEGPGTAAADVFSLGRVLFVALTGKPPDQCPELPTGVASQPDCELFLELNQIICKACEVALERRYSSAAQMRTELLEALRRLGG